MGIIEGAKAVADLARQYDKMDLYQKAVDLMAEVASLQEENYGLSKQVRELKGEVDRLHDAKRIKEELEYAGNFYRRKGEGQTKDEFYCCRCFDVDQLLVRVLGQGGGYYRCPQCDIAKGSKP